MTKKSFAEAIADMVLRQHEALPKTGKPQPNEHTVLAGFVVSTPLPCGQENGLRTTQDTERTPDQAANISDVGVSDEDEAAKSSKAGVDHALARLHVVSLGTGTKCLGASRRSAEGDALNDSHAEV
jgi:tRNA-specific adenosine deaminase 1